MRAFVKQQRTCSTTPLSPCSTTLGLLSLMSIENCANELLRGTQTVDNTNSTVFQTDLTLKHMELRTHLLCTIQCADVMYEFLLFRNIKSGAQVTNCSMAKNLRQIALTKNLQRNLRKRQPDARNIFHRVIPKL